MKRLRLRISEDAAREIREAVTWWRINRPAAPGALGADLRRGVELIRIQPGVGARASNVGLTAVRRLNLSRVRYHVYYRLSEDGSTVELLRFWHSNRGAAPNL